MVIFKGAEFLSYADFEACLKTYCASNNCLFVKRSSESMKDGSLTHLKTLKVGCPAKLRVKVVRPKDKSQPFLRLTVCDLDHSSHQVSKDVCQLYPENRRVVLDEASQLLASSATIIIKTSELKAMLEQRHNHDVYNLKQSLKPSVDDTQACEGIRKKILEGVVVPIYV